MIVREIAKILGLALAAVLVSCSDPPAMDTTDAGPDLDSDSDADTDSDADSDADLDTDTGEPPYEFAVEEVGGFVAGVHGMAFAEDGTLYLSNSYEHVDPAERIYTLAAPYTGEPIPTGIAGDIVSGLTWAAGSLYVSVTGEDRVDRYDGALALQESWDVPAPWNTAWVGPGMMAVTYDGLVLGLNEAGATTEILTGLAYPFGIADNGDNTFWISQQVGAEDDGIVSRFGLCGDELQVVDHVFSNPEGMALDDRGYLYVADTVAGEVIRVSPAGDDELITDQYEIPIVVARSPDGDIWFNTGGAQSRLVRISLTD